MPGFNEAFASIEAVPTDINACPLKDQEHIKNRVRTRRSLASNAMQTGTDIIPSLFNDRLCLLVGAPLAVRAPTGLTCVKRLGTSSAEEQGARQRIWLVGWVR